MRSVSGVVASYWNLPVSVTSPAYRQSAVSSGISPPIVSISRNTISQVDDASPSISGIVPSPSFER